MKSLPWWEGKLQKELASDDFQCEVEVRDWLNRHTEYNYN